MASTAADIKKELDKLGVEYPSKAKKAKLEELLADAQSAPTDSSSEGEADVAGEGPTDLEQGPEPEVAPPDYDGPVLLKPLMRQAGILPVGAPVPAGLSESDLERLQRLGIIAGGASPIVPGFDVFKGSDDQYYWHLRAENGEIVAQGEGYSNRQAAERGIDAVKDAVAAG